MKCKICGNEKGNEQFKAKEMMFGFRDEFVYFQCANCGCLQIKEIPDNMSRYYPSDYHSFQMFPGIFANPVRWIARRLRNCYAITQKGILGKLIYKHIPYGSLWSLSHLKLTKGSRILDVGCGAGSVLNSLRELGFKNLLGVDPYIEKDINYADGLTILKKPIHKIQGEFDLIMFHRSFEHIESPVETLLAAWNLLSSGGICLLRIPMVDCWAWENYRANWVQLDAPRHLFLHSKKSIDILAKKAGFRIKEIIYDSTEFQFWGSEQYKKDISLCPRNSTPKPSRAIFSRREIKIFKEKAEKLNSEGNGDQAVLYLEKI